MWILHLLLACGPDTPCERYVAYMCDCHPDYIDCDVLSEALLDAEPDVQDACAVDLDEQKEADAQAGTECPGG